MPGAAKIGHINGNHEPVEERVGPAARVEPEGGNA
jgi:hypothetical protein